MFRKAASCKGKINDCYVNMCILFLLNIGIIYTVSLFKAYLNILFHVIKHLVPHTVLLERVSKAMNLCIFAVLPTQIKM